MRRYAEKFARAFAALRERRKREHELSRRQMARLAAIIEADEQGDTGRATELLLRWPGVSGNRP
jgi:hypothetical protein